MIASPAPAAVSPGDSLVRAPRNRDGLVVALLGASNMLGFEDTGFGGPTATPFPAGLTYYVNGASRTSWSDPHGPEVGLIAAAVADGRNVAGWTLIKRAVAGSAMTSWYQGGSPMNTDVLGYATTLSKTPDVIVAVVPGADTATAGLGALVWGKLALWLDPLTTAWHRSSVGSPGVILVGPVSYDDGTDPGHATARASARRYTVGGAGRRTWVSTAGCESQPGSTHLTSAGQIELGRRIWLALRRGGVA